MGGVVGGFGGGRGDEKEGGILLDRFKISSPHMMASFF